MEQQGVCCVRSVLCGCRAMQGRALPAVSPATGVWKGAMDLLRPRALIILNPESVARSNIRLNQGAEERQGSEERAGIGASAASRLSRPTWRPLKPTLRRVMHLKLGGRSHPVAARPCACDEAT